MNPFIHSTVASPVQETTRPTHRLGVRVSPGARSRLAQLMLGVACLATAPWAHAVDVNSAQVLELQKVQGIGPKTAQMIIDERERGGPFESLQDLSDRVKGIGPKKAARLKSAGLKVAAGAVVSSGGAVNASAAATSSGSSEAAPATRFSGFFAR